MSKRSHRSRANQRLRGYRTLTLNGEMFFYHIGRTFVVIRDAGYKRLWWPRCSAIDGVTGHWGGAITPADIAEWIRRQS